MRKRQFMLLLYFVIFLSIPYVTISSANKNVLATIKDKAQWNQQLNSTIDNREYNWYTLFDKVKKEPVPPRETVHFLSRYNCSFKGSEHEKSIYLTFDEGYENGNTSRVLDVLSKHNVKAAFFVVKPYILKNAELIRRMATEGHLVCNHSSTHPSMASIQDKDRFAKELSHVEEAYHSATGETMPKFFRPPMGKYSEQSLAYTTELGYKTVFWSLAYYDWDIKKQPDPAASVKNILSKTHNGAIILLHTVSATNAKILDTLLTEWTKEGYTFKSLSDLD